MNELRNNLVGTLLVKFWEARAGPHLEVPVEDK